MVGYHFVELDEETRTHMLAEIDLDVDTHGTPYVGKTLTVRGLADYEILLRAAVARGTEEDLVRDLSEHGRVSNPPSDARRLGQTEFNRFYIRGVCLRAAAHGTTSVTVYRAHGSASARPGSLDLDGQSIPAPRVLANIRGRIDGDPEIGLGKVNSGLTARCGCDPCLTR